MTAAENPLLKDVALRIQQRRSGVADAVPGPRKPTRGQDAAAALALTKALAGQPVLPGRRRP